ncbi:MAG: ankyrin repeat domain-containing protein, partial [Candidatus Riflebacteria bacterium]|nr:ankyrin repeat domain-containing protein [Candidatus Riflebacteria bacterium]
MKNIKVFILCLSIYAFFNTFYCHNNLKAEKSLTKSNSELKHYYVQNTDVLAGKFDDEFVPDDNSSTNTKKPVKSIDRYYYSSEEELIKEVYDSLQTDYEYNFRGSKYSPGQVKAMLTTITYQNDYLKLLDTLLEHGFATPFITPKQDFDILSMTYAAASSDKTDYLNVLIKHGADLTIVQDLDGATLLHAAARNGNIDLAKKVLDAGIPVNIEDKRSKTPVYFAIENNEY